MEEPQQQTTPMSERNAQRALEIRLRLQQLELAMCAHRRNAREHREKLTQVYLNKNDRDYHLLQDRITCELINSIQAQQQGLRAALSKLSCG